MPTVLAVFKAGLAKERNKLALYRELLKSPHVDLSEKKYLRVVVRLHKNQIRIYKDLIKQAEKSN